LTAGKNALRIADDSQRHSAASAVWRVLIFVLQKKQLSDAIIVTHIIQEVRAHCSSTMIDEALEQALFSWDAHDEAAARSYLSTAVELASHHGCL
jgi:hypothetical protein